MDPAQVKNKREKNPIKTERRQQRQKEDTIGSHVIIGERRTIFPRFHYLYFARAITGPSLCGWIPLPGGYRSTAVVAIFVGVHRENISVSRQMSPPLTRREFFCGNTEKATVAGGNLQERLVQCLSYCCSLAEHHQSSRA